MTNNQKVYDFRSYNRNNNSNLINNNFSIGMMDAICRFSISESLYINKSHLMNLRSMIDTIDPNSYINNPEIRDRYEYIRYALIAKLDLGLKDKSMVVDYISSNSTINVNMVDINKEVSEDEINYINSACSDTINYAFMDKEMDKLASMIVEYKESANKNTGRGEMLKNFMDTLDTIRAIYNKNITNASNDIVFSLEPEEFHNAITHTYDTITAPNRRLGTMMQGLNRMTDGGFENGRVYMFVGMTGAGKSLTMLNLMHQLRIANRNYKCKDLTKKPCIVMLTMENDVIETITRYFSMLTGEDMRACISSEDAYNKMMSTGYLDLSNEYPIDMRIIYKAHRSVDTNYLYRLRDQLSEEGKEMVCLIQDHVKRIRSATKESDVRLELGEVVNQMKSFATYADIPVITVSHVNRTGSGIIEDAMMNNSRNNDITKTLGKASVGESFLMLDNLDGGYLINKMEVKGSTFMAFKALKCRYECRLYYFAQPFVPDTIRLAEDLGQEPLFLESLNDYQTDNEALLNKMKEKGVTINNYSAKKNARAGISENEPNLLLNAKNAKEAMAIANELMKEQLEGKSKKEEEKASTKKKENKKDSTKKSSKTKKRTPKRSIDVEEFSFSPLFIPFAPAKELENPFGIVEDGLQNPFGDIDELRKYG